MKKLIAILLAVLCVVGVFAGCNNTTNPNETQGGPKETTPGDEGKITLTLGIPISTNVEDYDTNGYTLWLEEKTGYNIEFQYYAASAADYKTQLATQMLDPSVKLPDVLVHFTSLGDAVWETYGEDGYFIDLTEMWDNKELSKTWWDAVEEFDADFINNVITRCTADNGKRYAFPMIERGLVDSLPFAVHINKAWMEECGITEDPTNPDELYEVLKQFKTKICDVKGEGYYPLLGAKDSTLASDVLWWIFSFFCPGYDYDRWFTLSADGKEIVAPFTTEGYREGLKYIHKLIEEGLLPKTVFTLNQTDLRKIYNAEGGSKIGVAVGHTTVYFNDLNNENLYDYKPLNMYAYCKRTEYGNSRTAFITEDCENVEAAWNMLMVMCTLESAYCQRYGIKGENWDWAEEGTKSYIGMDCDIKLMSDPWGMVGNECWKKVGPTVLPNAESETVDLGEISEWMQYRYNLNGEAYKNFCVQEEKNKYVYPIIILTTEESETNTAERSNTQSSVKSWRNKFCQGDKDPNSDADWAEYLAELEKNGLQVWIDQYQEVYEERYMAAVLAAGDAK